MDGCVFCKIARGEITVPTVYEDDFAVAFIDLHPLNPGHTLVIPKRHFDSVFAMPEDGFVKLMNVVHKVAQRIDRAFPSKHLGVVVKGFDVVHAHVHLIPQHSIGDIVSGKYGAHLPPEASLAEREDMAERIRNARA